MTTRIQLGYVPLSDALPLIVAEQTGLFLRHGLDVELQAMRSWAQLRDALLMRQLDAAHCLPGIPLAAQAGLYGKTPALACALTLNHYGNAITLHRDLHERLSKQGPLSSSLRRHALARRHEDRRLTLASVFPVSKHEFELRHWLRSMELDPDRDVKLVVIPPPLVAQALRENRIDGFCVGEPWNSLAMSAGQGQVVATSRSLKLPGTEKVLAVRETWLEDPAHLALLSSLQEAGEWLADTGNRREALPWLSNALGLEQQYLEPALLDEPSLNQLKADKPFLEFSGIGRPQEWDARWLLGQMENNLRMPAVKDPGGVCARAFRTDIYDLAHAETLS